MTFLFPLFLILYEFCTNMSNDMYLSALPRISEDFSTSANLVQLTITAWLAGDTSVQLIVGPLADRYRRRFILFGGGLLFVLSTLGCALAPSIGFLLLIKELKLTPLQFGWLQVPVFGAYIVGAQLVKPLMEKIGKDKLIVFGLSIASLSGICLLFLPFFYPEKTLSFILPMVGYALGFDFAAAPLNRTTLTETQEKRGAAIAVFYLMMIGSGTIISLILSVFDENAFSISIVIAASVFISFLLNTIRQRQDQITH